MIGRLLAIATAAFLILVACNANAQKCNVQGECVGTVIASVQVYSKVLALGCVNIVG